MKRFYNRKVGEHFLQVWEKDDVGFLVEFQNNFHELDTDEFESIEDAVDHFLKGFKN